jgi:hypothetical protein
MSKIHNITKILVKKEHKTFNLDNDSDQIVTSGGLLIYRFGKKGMELLLINSRGVFEDFGGKIDDDDMNIYETVAREAYEESNCLLDQTKILKRLQKAPKAYMKKSKYVVYLIEANKAESSLEQADFGDFEIHDGIERSVRWVSIDTFLSQEVIKYKLNWRLKSATLFAKLTEIKNEKKSKTCLFSTSESSN